MSRQIMRIDLTGPARKAVGTLSDRRGMPQVRMLSRLIEWYVAQAEPVQLSIIGPRDKASDRKTARAILDRMINGKKP
jgi:hypothetical protein